MTATRDCHSCGATLDTGARFCSHCGRRADDEVQWDATIGERLQRALGSGYSLIGELGRGGFAVVYSVRDVARGRYLAVKVMRPSLLTSSHLRERFRRETELASRLDHPNILPVVFTGKGQGLVYYAMPRVRGDTLRERIDREGPLAMEEAHRVFEQVARGLAHAHERSVAHRDVKPANILLDRQGTVGLVDFGIAKALAVKGGTISITGEVVGTPEYMSPEQAEGKGNVDSRCDIYGLGVVGYEMLVGDVPYRGETVHDTLALHLNAPVPDVRARRAEVPPAFAAAIARCLAKKPRERWETADEAAAAAGRSAID
ncbi:MAG: serine/threonine-protein kinase [Gemmatimonadales bacterium]|jgi:serine/threonine-protein kinase